MSTTQWPTPVGALLSSPPRAALGQKPKKKATVTPRRFGRFFTPRTSSERGRKDGTRRRVFGDITTLATNQRSPKRRRIQDTSANPTEGNDTDGLGFEDLPSKVKGHFCTPDTTPERSSPLKRYDQAGYGTITPPRRISAGSAEYLTDTRKQLRDLPQPIVRAGYRGKLGGRISRELGWTSEDPSNSYCSDWQSDTTNFYSRSEDVHVCNNIVGHTPDKALPFCTASCNTNSLVAIGDEEGGVRLLESSKGGTPSFSRKYLSFRPHANAILDLAFSSDDMLLATASGDQTSRVIDMSTQRAIRTLSGHVSSVKQVCFQPGGTNNVIATSSRDGSVQVWDLRSKGSSRPVGYLKVCFEGISADNGADSPSSDMTWAPPIYTIERAHLARGTMASNTALPASRSASVTDKSTRAESAGRRGDVSITGLSFLSPSRSHLLLTSSEANASVKLWDLRSTHNSRRGGPTPLSTTRQPESHDLHRQFGLTSMVLSNDAARVYTLCRDNSVYAYSTSHLILGSAPELGPSTTKARRSGGAEKEGLGPLYGFRHPKLHAASFYVRLAVRPANGDKTELLAVGSNDCCAVVFPTDERYMSRRTRPVPSFSAILPSSTSLPPISSRSRRARPFAGLDASNARLNDRIPIYQHGSALVRGHDKEVTGMSWTSEGELITVGDDYQVRVWREGPEAEDLRTGGEDEGRRWGSGWAESLPDWDEEC